MQKQIVTQTIEAQLQKIYYETRWGLCPLAVWWGMDQWLKILFLNSVSSSY